MKRVNFWIGMSVMVLALGLVFTGCASTGTGGTSGTSGNTTSFYYDRGLRYMDNGDLDRAIADFTEAIRLMPDHGDAYFNRGLIYNQKQDFDRAIADFTQAIVIFSRFLNSEYDVKNDLYLLYSRRGMAYGSKRLDLAIADYNEAIKLDNTRKTAYTLRGAAYTAMEDYNRAIADFEKVLELDPKDENARDFLIYVTSKWLTED